MRNLLMAALAAATLVTALPATAQYQQSGGGYGDQHNDGRDQRGDGRDQRGDAGGYRGNGGDQRGDGGSYRGNGGDQRGGRGNDGRNFDYNRPPRGGYYADQYYRNGPQYRERALGRNDRIYRGRDNRYYCRRQAGTTGLIVGGLAGGLLGNSIAGGGSRLLGTVIGGAGGALLGQSIDRGQVRCR